MVKGTVVRNRASLKLSENLCKAGQNEMAVRGVDLSGRHGIPGVQSPGQHRDVGRYEKVSIYIRDSLALEGGPIAWVATHRVHHQKADKEGDPHSPRDGGLWAHIGWIITGKALHNSAGELLPFVPDLRKDKFHVWISKWHWVPLAVLSLALFAIGGWSCLLWGIFLRTVVNLHGT
jgi:fatty-acid desaturase